MGSYDRRGWTEFTYESTYEHRDEDGWRYRYRVIDVRALPPEINPEA